MAPPDRSANAAANRRYRRHAKGDHSQCDPARRCEELAALDSRTPDSRAGETAPTSIHGPVPAPPTAPGAGRLSERSQALHDELAPDLAPLNRLLLVEALRMADRLDYFDRLIGGKSRRGEWLRLQEGDQGEMRVVVDDLLAEARQHGTALKTMLAELTKVLPKPNAPAQAAKPSAIASLADAAARRRQAGSA